MSHNLDRNNSTCDQNRQKQDIKLGDNIYLKKLSSKTHKNNQKMEAEENEPQLRLNQDY